MVYIPVHPNCRCDWLPVVKTIQYPKSFFNAAGLAVPAALREPKETKKPTQGEEIVDII